MEQWWMKCFSKHVYKLILTSNMYGLQQSYLYFFPYNVTIYFNMFGALMEYRINNNMKDCLIVTIKHKRSRMRCIQVF